MRERAQFLQHYARLEFNYKGFFSLQKYHLKDRQQTDRQTDAMFVLKYWGSS